MIKLNVTLRNITLFVVLNNQGMLNRIFSFMDLGGKNRIMIYHIHFSKHGCFIIQSNILLFWEREVTSMVNLMMLEIVLIHVLTLDLKQNCGVPICLCL